MKKQMKAFPSKTHPGDYTRHEVNKGMNLRDYFAAKAMQAYVSQLHVEHFSNGVNETAYKMGISIDKFMSKASYEIADAMMEARK